MCHRAGAVGSVNTDMSGGYVTIPDTDPDNKTTTVAMSVTPDRSVFHLRVLKC